jgi:hypothetical protein
MILIAALGIGACVESRTTPVILPEPIWAGDGVNSSVNAMAAANSGRRDLRNIGNNDCIMLLILALSWFVKKENGRPLWSAATTTVPCGKMAQRSMSGKHADLYHVYRDYCVQLVEVKKEFMLIHN